MENFPKIRHKPLFYLVRILNIDLHAFCWDLHHGSPAVEGRTLHVTVLIPCWDLLRDSSPEGWPQHATALILCWVPTPWSTITRGKAPHVHGTRKVQWLLLESVSSDLFASHCFEWSLFRMYCTHVIVCCCIICTRQYTR